MIREFRDKCRWLSNLWYMETPIVDDFGYQYPTMEHYYVSQKTSMRIQKYMVSQCPTPGKVKRMGKGFKLPHTWEKKRIDVMYWALVHKFSSKNPWLQQKLINTGIQQIFEGNNWGDNSMIDIKPCPFCGIVPNLGSRMLTRDRKSAVDSVVHPITDKCALDMLIFRLFEWQYRVNSESIILSSQS